MDKILLEIRAGAGGDEASIFAGDLARMYQRYAVKHGFKFQTIDANDTSLYGIKSMVAQIQGPDVYEIFKHESGVHRVQRIPKTEKSGRVHTSTASVAVLPIVDPGKVQINPGDLDVVFFRSSGPGGQNVNKVETAVRITHRPTGIVVSSQVERSQYANKERAMESLAAKLYEQKQKEAVGEVSELRREQIGTADRSEKIRTYNFPQDRITDHRLNKSFHNIEKIMEGDMDKIVEAFRKNKE
ncbi:MAG TPA: PCRF domain-containing protein [Candidatus Colwellbacteria bacterium]|nr:PCRF domain-containing protein [Candidatus Colwellbacteria bacterium]